MHCLLEHRIQRSCWEIPSFVQRWSSHKCASESNCWQPHNPGRCGLAIGSANGQHRCTNVGMYLPKVQTTIQCFHVNYQRTISQGEARHLTHLYGSMSSSMAGYYQARACHCHSPSSHRTASIWPGFPDCTAIVDSCPHCCKGLYQSAYR